MSPFAATAVFYALMVVAGLTLRGNLTPFPGWVDGVLAFALCALAFAVWARGWRPSHPLVGLVESPTPQSPAKHVILWTGLLAGAMAVFVGPMSWTARQLAPPAPAVGSHSAGRQNPQPLPSPKAGPQPVPSVPDPLAGTEVSAQSSDIERAVPAGNRADDPQRGAGPIARALAAAKRMSRRDLALALLSGAAAAALMIWWLRRWTRSAPTATGGPAAPLPAPAYLREFRRLCEAWGCPPFPGQTVRDLLRRLGDSGHTVTAFEPLAVYHYRVSYENAAADNAREKLLRREIQSARRHRSRFLRDPA